MTRREFIQQFLKAGAAVIVGACWVAKKVSPRSFVWADSLGKYPGVLRPLKNTHEQGKWSG